MVEGMKALCESTGMDGYFDIYITFPDEANRQPDGTWENTSAILSTIQQRNLAIYNSLSHAFERYPIDPHVVRDPDIHILSLAIASQMPFGLDIFRRFTCELRGFIYDQLDDVSFTGMVDNIKYGDQVLQNGVVMDTLEMTPLREMAKEDPICKKRYDMIIDAIIPHFRRTCNFLAKKRFDYRFGISTIPTDIRNIKFNQKSIWVFHAECTGWPLGAFNHIPAIYQVDRIIDENVHLVSIGDEGSVAHDIMIDMRDFNKLWRSDANCIYTGKLDE